ncbi:NAD(P)/FAD-dependent oxidoreductase [Parasphingopyxis sp. CP4]|uniref:flavin-containing monooxygenase n=1 Tax=Parasphingopyxis sp. CP4 TaxID=2724527 RepID=UPI0015A17C2B|nr:NAD(P)/FAD-dependent oxidoreductase [Parasphingopyxis sp. CP4]QLC22873.1 NAD(P)/FAD-dependent oxidoreductase [Parasphingopyxis sp. CP4]
MSDSRIDVAIVGAGFSGLYMLHKLRKMGLKATIFEAGDGVGGTWYWNRYPGARCDIESMEYSYSWSEELEQDWEWSERYSPQPEILDYANHVADRFELRDDIRFSTRVTAAHFDEEANLWHVTIDSGETVQARHVVMATGCLSSPNKPEFEGEADFEGETYLTGLWPHEGVDFSGKRVGVIGTGSSAIQSIPIIAREADALTVFQRTPNYAIPAHNHPLDPDYAATIKSEYPAIREEARDQAAGFVGSSTEHDDLAIELPKEDVRAELEKRWARGGLTFMASYPDMGISLKTNDIAAEFIRDKIRERVDDPETAELLCPRDYPAGAKRMCVDIDYYETFNKDHVSLVDINATPIERITAKGVQTSDQEYEFDAIVFATGFDAMTGTLAKIDIRGRGGAKLSEKWAAGPLTYLGLMSTDYPNLFLVTGPQSPSVISNMMVSIEQHVDWIADCIGAVGDGVIEPIQQAETEWVEHTNMIASMTVYPYAKSWYLGDNIPGKPRIFMAYLGGVPEYRKICDAVIEQGYAGFALNGVPSNAKVDPMEFMEVDERLLPLIAEREAA